GVQTCALPISLGPAAPVFILGVTRTKQDLSCRVCGVYAFSLAPSCGGFLCGRIGLFPAFAGQKREPAGEGGGTRRRVRSYFSFRVPGGIYGPDRTPFLGVHPIF